MKKHAYLKVFPKKVPFFFFPCHLCGGHTTWTTTGFKDLKDLLEWLAKHDSIRLYEENGIGLGLFGRAKIAALIDATH